MRRLLLPVAVVAIAAVTGLLAGPSPVASQDSTGRGMQVVDQQWAVGPGGSARVVLQVLDEVPEFVPTTTTTTTTTTTSTTTTTTIDPTATSDPTTDPDTDVAAPPAAATTTAPPATGTTTGTTIPAAIETGPELSVQVRAHQRLVRRSAVEAAIGGEPGPIIDVVEFDFADVAEFDPATGEQRLVIDLPIADDAIEVGALDLLDPGVYPLTVQLRRNSLLVAAHTTFIELVGDGPGLGPFTFTVVADVADPGPDASDRELDDALDRLAEAAALVDGISAPVAVAIPASVTRVAADRRPELLEMLRAGLTDRDEVLTRPLVPLDPSSAAAADVGDEFLDQLEAAELATTALLPDATTSRAAWRVDARLTAAGAALLDRAGVPLLLVPFDRYTTWDGSLPTLTDTTALLGARIDDIATIPFMVTDRATGALEAERADGDTTPVERAVELMAAASTSRIELGPGLRSLVLATPELDTPDVDVLQQLEQFVAEHPDYRFATPGVVADSTTTNSFFVDGEPFVVELDSRPDQSIRVRADEVAAARLIAADVTSMLPTDDPRPARWDETLDTSLSTGVTDAAAADRIDDVLADLDAVKDAVEQPEPFTFTLAGTESNIPLRIENRGATPLDVVVRAAAEQLRFPQPEVDVTLDAATTTDVEIPVEARGNGVFPVTIEVLTPAGNQLLEPVTLTARVNTLTGLGRVATVGGVLVLATWWWSDLRRRRRDRRAAYVASAVQRHPAAADDVATADVAGGSDFAADRSPDAVEAAIVRQDDPAPGGTPRRVGGESRTFDTGDDRTDERDTDERDTDDATDERGARSDDSTTTTADLGEGDAPPGDVAGPNR